MKDNIVKILQFLMFVLGILMLVLSLMCINENDKEERNKLISDNYEKGYLDACKDFYKGKTKYDLVKNDDGTVVWKKINK